MFLTSVHVKPKVPELSQGTRAQSRRAKFPPSWSPPHGWASQLCILNLLYMLTFRTSISFAENRRMKNDCICFTDTKQNLLSIFSTTFLVSLGSLEKGNWKKNRERLNRSYFYFPGQAVGRFMIFTPCHPVRVTRRAKFQTLIAHSRSMFRRSAREKRKIVNTK